MLRADDELQLVNDAGRDTALARSQDVAANDSDVDFAIAHTFLYDPRVRDSERDCDPGIGLPKARDERGQDVRSGRCTGADCQRSTLKAVELCERLPPGSEC